MSSLTDATQVKSAGSLQNRKSRQQDEQMNECLPSEKLLEVKDISLSGSTVFDSGYDDVAPDGGWGWVICLASFWNSFMIDGIAYTFGVILPEYSAFFGSSVGSTSLANSLLSGIYVLVGPIVGALINKYGCRSVSLAGSVIGTLTFLVSIFSPSIAVFHIVYGVIGGLGFGMIYLPTIVGVGIYFKKKRAIATGIAVAGSGFGTFALAPMSEYLLNHFDWKGTHFFFAGLLMQCCVFSGLMRPLPVRKILPRTRDSESPSSEKKLLLNGTASSGLPPEGDDQGHDVEKYDVSKYNAEKSNSPATCDKICRKRIHSVGELHGNALVQSQYSLSPRLHASAYIGLPSRTPKEVAQDLRRPMYRKDIFYSGSVFNIDSTYSDAGFGSITEAEQITSDRSCLSRLPKPVGDILKEMTDPHVLKHRGLLVLCAVNFFFMMGFQIPIIFSANRAKEYGIDDEKAALLVSIMGICNTAGRILFGFLVVFIPGLSTLLLNNVCMIVTAISVLLTPFTTSFTQMALAIATYGILSSTFISLMSVIVCDLIGVDKLTNAYGLICLLRGMTCIFGSPLGGMLYDLTGSYDVTFYVGGASMLIGGCFSLLLHLNCIHSSGNKSIPENT